MKFAFLAAAPLALMTLPAMASVPTVSVPVGRIQRFTGTSNTLYFETRGNWYRADMAGSCFNLPDANRIRIATGPDDRIDGSSAVVVGRDRCPVAYVTPSSDPPVELLLNPNG